MAFDEHKTKPSPRPDSGELAIKPYLDRTGSGRVGRLERFSHYVARQIGFEDACKCPQLCKIADDYLRKTDGIESSIFEFFADDSGAEQLYVKLIEELDKCILAYFGFNWTHTSLMITQLVRCKSAHEYSREEDPSLSVSEDTRAGFHKFFAQLKSSIV